MSTIENSWVVEMGLYNHCIFCSAPNFLLGSRKGKWGRGERRKGVIIFESEYPFMSVPMYHTGKK